MICRGVLVYQRRRRYHNNRRLYGVLQRITISYIIKTRKIVFRAYLYHRLRELPHRRDSSGILIYFADVRNMD